MKQKLLLLSAVFFGVLAFILTHHQINLERKRAMRGAKDVKLVYVKKDMAAGEKIQAEDIVGVPRKLFRVNIHKYVHYDARNRIINRTLRYGVKKGEALEWNDLKLEKTRAGEGLTGKIPSGMRAISISVDTTSSVTGLINYTDHVDIVGTFRFPEMKGDKNYDTVTMTILQNVIVLATGTDYGQHNYSSTRSLKKKSYGTVTLALTPKEVEMIIFASQKGRLFLSLRNYEETKVETDLQEVNFKYLEQNVKQYNVERQKFMRDRTRNNYKGKFK